MKIFSKTDYETLKKCNNRLQLNYVYRIYDNKSGTVIVAGETTSWGSLAENLARGISKRLSDEMLKAK